MSKDNREEHTELIRRANAGDVSRICLNCAICACKDAANAASVNRKNNICLKDVTKCPQREEYRRAIWFGNWRFARCELQL